MLRVALGCAALKNTRLEDERDDYGEVLMIDVVFDFCIGETCQ